MNSESDGEDDAPERDASAQLHVPMELVEPLSSLFPSLVAKGARRVEVFSYRRPGEQPYWLVFLVTADGRKTVGTPDLRHLSLEAQVPELLAMLSGWATVPKAGGLPDCP